MFCPPRGTKKKVSDQGLLGKVKIILFPRRVSKYMALRWLKSTDQSSFEKYDDLPELPEFSKKEHTSFRNI